MAELIVAFRNCANALKDKQVQNFYR
jgi:hypothetical protein